MINFSMREIGVYLKIVQQAERRLTFKLRTTSPR